MKLLPIILVVLCGCAGVPKGSPKKVAFENSLAANLIAKYAKPGGIPNDPVPEVQRNQVLNDLIFLTDLNYDQFINGLYQGRATFDTITDLALIGLGGAGTLISGEAAKSILAAISAGVAGGRVSVDKNFFLQQSTTALIATMDANRKTKLVQIQENMITLSSADYPLSQGMTQIGEYYRAGTIVGALQEITTQAGNEKTAATIKLQGVMKLKGPR